MTADREPNLSDDEATEVDELRPAQSLVVYEVIRRDGEHELSRPFASLFWSGLAAGIAISASVVGEGLLHHYLPDADWRPAVENLGYSFGFLIVILGRLQLFTENTLTAILPLLTKPNWQTLSRTARLWSVVLLANIAGAFLAAFSLSELQLLHPDYMPALLSISHHYADLSAIEALLQGIPAGFLIAVLVWILPGARPSAFFVITAITYLIALGSFTHVIAGSVELFLLMLAGELAILEGLVFDLVPTLIGNVIGGTGLFALLVYAQLRKEI